MIRRIKHFFGWCKEPCGYRKYKQQVELVKNKPGALIPVGDDLLDLFHWECSHDESSAMYQELRKMWVKK